jgi:hypothetical protein
MWSVSQQVRSAGSAASAAPLLATVQLQARRLVDVEGRYPLDVVSQLGTLSVSGVSVTAQAAGTDEVSAHRSGETEFVMAAVSGDDCLVLVDRIGGSVSWVRVRQGAESCSAAALEQTVLALPVGGTSIAPQQVES